MEKKARLILGVIIALIIVVLVLLGFAGVSIYKSHVGTNDSLDELSDAIKSEDTEYLKDYIKLQGRETQLSNEELENIVLLLKDYKVEDDLKAYLESTQENIFLKKDEDKYVLVLKPYDIEIEASLPGARVFLNGEEVRKFDEDKTTLKLRNIMPGYHKIKLLYEGKYAHLEEETEVICFDPYNNELYLYMDLGGDKIEVTSNEDKAFLYVNDKNTNISLHSSYTLGPVVMDGTITLSAKAVIDGKTYQSEKVDIVNNRYQYELDVNITDSTADQKTIDNQDNVAGPKGIKYEDIYDIQKVIDDYQYSLVAAINYRDYTFVAPFIQAGSPLEKAQIELIEDLSSRGILEELIDYNIHNITKQSNKYEARVTETHKILYPNGESKQVNNTWTYTLIQSNDEFYLTDIRR